MDLLKNLEEISKIPSDINEHLETLCEFAQGDENDSPTVVELGVRGGISTQALIAGVSQTTTGRVYSYDIQDVRPHDDPQSAIMLQRFGPLAKDKLSKWWTFKIADSLVCHDEWEDGSIDMLFIDTDHNPDQLYKELNLWHKKVKEDGVIVMHDMAVPHFRLKEAIVKFVGEHEHYEYDENTNNFGLGWLRKE